MPRAVTEELARLRAHYEIVDKDERGGNSHLYFARDRVLGRGVAIKFYHGEPGDRQHQEPQLLATIRSDNVLPIHYARNVGDGWALFVTPRCEGGDLQDVVREGVSARRALDIVAGICAGVSAMHAAHFLHRDLKPANIVMDGAVPKIADFGSVRLIPDGADAVHASQHSIGYRPPETFASGLYTRAGDVYQIGIVAYELLGGAFHYDGTRYLNKNDRREYEAMTDEIDRSIFVDRVFAARAQAGRLLDWNTLPPWAEPAKKALKRMTAREPSARFQTVGEAAVALARVRPAVADWRRTAAGARLATPAKAVDLVRTADDAYDVFFETVAGRRKRHALCGRSLAGLVADLS